MKWRENFRDRILHFWNDLFEEVKGKRIHREIEHDYPKFFVEALDDELATLKVDERMCLRLFLGMEDGTHWTYEDISKELGAGGRSRERARQICHVGLRKLCHPGRYKIRLAAFGLK